MSAKKQNPANKSPETKYYVDRAQEELFGNHLYTVLSIPGQKPRYMRDLYDTYFRHTGFLDKINSDSPEHKAIHDACKGALQKHFNQLYLKKLMIKVEEKVKGSREYMKYGINPMVNARPTDFYSVKPREELHERKVDHKTGNGKMVALEKPKDVMQIMNDIAKSLPSPTEQMPLGVQPGGVIPEPHVAPLQELLSEVTGMKKTIDSLQLKVSLLEQANKDLSTSAVEAHRLAKEAKSIAKSARGRR